MVLNDNRIRSLVAAKVITIDPYMDDSLSPASYDLSIGAYQSLNMTDKHRADCLQKDKTVEIFPGESFLASTVEILGLPNNITAEIVSKSSTGRKGLSLFSPGWIDPGFIGQLTVGMKNETYKPITLKYGQKLWQVIFEDCDPAGQAYQGHYQGSEGIVEDKSGDATIGI
jgi:dCTP deaminase